MNKLPARHPFKITLIYAVLSAIWVLLSDSLIEMIFSSQAQLAIASTLKGWLFVLATSLFIYWLLSRHKTEAAADDETVTKNTRSFWIGSLLLALIIVPLTATLVNWDIQDKKTSEIDRLQAIADLKVEYVHNWLEERRQDLIYIQNTLALPASFKRGHDKGDQQAFQQLTEQLEKIEFIGQFEGVNLLDSAGISLWKSNDIKVHGKDATIKMILRLAASGEVQHFGPYRDDHGNAHLDFIVPFKDERQKIDFILLLHMDPGSHLLEPVSEWPVPSQSGEVVLFRRDGAEIMFLNNLKYTPNAAMRLRWPLDDRFLLAAQLAREDAAMARVVEGKDYRNESVFGVGRRIPESDWYLLAKMDWSEVYDEAMQSAVWMGLSGFLILFIGITELYLLHQRQQITLVNATSRAQAERIQALNLLSTIADSSTDAIYAKDRQGRYLFFNRQAELVTGKPKHEVLGKDDTYLFPPDQAEMVMNNDRMLIELDKVLTLHEHLDTLTGTVTFMATKGPLRDQNDEIIGTFGVSRDITEMYAMEQDLREKEARYRELVDNMSDGVAVYEAVDDGNDFIFREYNKAGERIGKNRRNDVIGRRVTEVFPSIESLGLLEIFKRVWESGKGEHYPINSYRDDRLQLWVENYVFRLPGGELVAIYNDFTDRKLAEEALRDNEEKYRLLVENQTDIVVKVDIQGRFEFVSPSYCKMFGKEEHELLGQKFMPEIHKDDQENTFQRIKRAYKPPYVSYLEHRVMTASGWCWLGWVVNAVLNKERRVISLIGSGRDITDRKQAELKIKRLNDELEARVSERTRELESANKELESFVYSVSHDLRAPLRAVTGFTQILVNRHMACLNDEGRHYLENVLQAGNHMGELIEDLLQYSRTGQGTLQMRPIELDPIIKGLEITFQERFKESNAKLIIDKPLEPPMGDITLIGQQFTNLIDNALTYASPNRAPVIRIASKRKGDQVMITLEDNGIGIAPEYHEKIFKVFQRLHSQDEYPGTGVGLAIVAKAARMMGGEVKVESSLGKGSQFTLILPCGEKKGRIGEISG